jgi:hypothetical protein
VVEAVWWFLVGRGERILANKLEFCTIRADGMLFSTLGDISNTCLFCQVIGGFDELP